MRSRGSVQLAQSRSAYYPASGIVSILLFLWKYKIGGPVILGRSRFRLSAPTRRSRQ